jgi:hypothetical protein
VVDDGEMTRSHKGPVLIDFQVEQEDSGLSDGSPPERRSRNDSPSKSIVETAADA